MSASVIDWIVGICTGLISGLVSGVVIAYYFRKKDKAETRRERLRHEFFNIFTAQSNLYETIDSNRGNVVSVDAELKKMRQIMAGCILLKELALIDDQTQMENEVKEYIKNNRAKQEALDRISNFRAKLVYKIVRTDVWKK